MATDPSLYWISVDKGIREIRGRGGIKRDRYLAVKFPKTMCPTCNNERSKPFNKAYVTHSNYIFNNRVSKHAGVDLAGLFGESWREDNLSLARYYAKHFGCRMVWQGIPVPHSLRQFLDGANDIQDCHMSLVVNDEVKRQGSGLALSPDGVFVDRNQTRFSGCIMANYINNVGVRFLWDEGGIAPEASQFFHFPYPLLNFFRTHEDVFAGRARKPGWFARFSQWLSAPPDPDLTD